MPPPLLKSATEPAERSSARMDEYDKYCTSEGFQEMLFSKSVKFVRGSYLVALGESGKSIRRRQDLPDEAFYRPSEAMAWVKKSSIDNPNLHAFQNPIRPKAFVNPHTFVFVLSYKWLAAHHPDPHMHHLHIVFPVIKGAMKNRRHDLEMVWDFMSLVQKNELGQRTPEENDLWHAGLQAQSILYGHRFTTVWMQCVMPDGCTASPYSNSGWAHFESCVSRICKPHSMRLDLAKLKDAAEYVVIVTKCPLYTSFESLVVVKNLVKGDRVVATNHARTVEGYQLLPVKLSGGKIKSGVVPLTSVRVTYQTYVAELPGDPSIENFCVADAPPPVTPAKFEAGLEKRTFGEEGDAEKIKLLYSKSFEALSKNMKTLDFAFNTWSSSDIAAMLEVLP